MPASSDAEILRGSALEERRDSQEARARGGQLERERHGIELADDGLDDRERRRVVGERTVDAPGAIEEEVGGIVSGECECDCDPDC